MKAILSVAAIFSSLLVTFASAQSNYTIDPNSVPLATRDAWCESETSQCPLICADNTKSLVCQSNNCDSATLTYSCVCSNGISPNLSQYSLTIPFYICQEWGTQCVANCGNDNTCAAACRDKHPCGALHPKGVSTKTTAAGAHSPTAKSTQTAYTGFADGASSAASSLTPIGSGEMGGVLKWVGFIGGFLLVFATGL